MILNSITYRQIKNTLAKVPGAPGSAQLGEAMAAGWGLPDFHALKQVIDAVETDLSVLPRHYDLHPARMIERLRKIGSDETTAKNLALTMLLTQEGDAALEWIDDVPEVIGATVYRLDITAGRWQDEVERVARILWRHAPGVTWRLPLDHLQGSAWRYIDDTTEDYSTELRMLSPGKPGLRELDEDDYEADERAIADGGVLPIQILESALNTCSGYLPEGARVAVIEDGGIFVRYDKFNFCLAHFAPPES